MVKEVGAGVDRDSEVISKVGQMVECLIGW